MSEANLSLRESVLLSQPGADINLLEKLASLVHKYNLKWIPSPSGNRDGAFFIMSQVAIAKGLKPSDYKDHWATGSDKSAQSNLAGRFFKIEGDYLRLFKESWKEAHKQSLGRASSIYVGDWEHCFSYLTQGNGETARDFQSLGAKAIEIVSRNNYSSRQQQQHGLSEEEIQRELMLLASYSNLRLRFEVGSKLGINTQDNATYRRWDWVERTPKSVRIYELKSHRVTEIDIKTSLFDKKYALIAAETYQKPIEFVFTGLDGISWEAKDFIDDLTSGSGCFKLGEIPIKVSFIDLFAISDRVATNITRTSPAEQWPWLQKKLSEFQIVSSRTVAKLKTKIDKAYASGLLKSNKVQYINSTGVVV
ncbi:hypothetical protein NIES2100_35230 [Calothrix sp. NIES-2100]|uniref:hypothetical protein n=1 Tax=Calothrix sp. NIES-2100 TaxID=1954172 RepID=UPI000B60B3FD|nr:hypothetical protein NIES2100_35230 [Calothrix sp. NIES-2100]